MSLRIGYVGIGQMGAGMALSLSRAGFDVIGERENLSGWSEFGMPFFWRDWGYNRKEVRDDRVDFFLTEAGDILINEINTMPGFTPTSMFPRMWAASGIGYAALIDELISLAMQRRLGLR